jgi:hypothetical protein
VRIRRRRCGPEGACRSRHLCRPSKRSGAAALPTEQPPRRSWPDCWKRTNSATPGPSHRATGIAPVAGMQGSRDGYAAFLAAYAERLGHSGAGASTTEFEGYVRGHRHVAIAIALRQTTGMRKQSFRAAAVRPLRCATGIVPVVWPVRSVRARNGVSEAGRADRRVEVFIWGARTAGAIRLSESNFGSVQRRHASMGARPRGTGRFSAIAEQDAAISRAGAAGRNGRGLTCRTAVA